MKYFYVFSTDGQTCLEAHSGAEVVPMVALEAKYSGCLVAEFDAIQCGGAPKSALRATVVDGQVVVTVVADSHLLTLDVQLTGGDGMSPPGVAVNSEPPQELVATATLRDQAGNVVPLTDPQGWRLSVYHSDGRVAFIALVPISAGVASARIPANLAQLPQGVLVLDDRDFEEITVGGESYKVIMPAKVVFKAYVKLAG